MNLEPLINYANSHNLHILNLIVRQNDRIIAAHDFAEEKRILLWSVSKTFTSMAIGIAENEGLFKITDRLCEYFSVPQGPHWQQITLRDLLCMGTGQRRCPLTLAMNRGESLDDVEKLFFNEPIVDEPGTHFMYNNSATYMLSKLISLRSGVSLNEFLKPRIFDPLAIENVQWEADVNGISFGCSGLYLNAHELSKFGQLLLNEGNWQGESLIPANYIRAATRKQIDNSDFNEFFATSDHRSGYGYQIWLNSVPGSYRLDGLYGQYGIVIPEKQAVITFVSAEPQFMTAILELAWQFLVEQL